MIKLLKNIFCRHKNLSIVVIDGFANWEKTVIKCCDCNKILPKTITNIKQPKNKLK